jgi:hypothetical protein
MNETEKTVRDFVDFLRGQTCSPPDYNENVLLRALEITNNSKHYTIPLVVGRRIAQIIFFETGPIVDADYSKTGKYNLTNLRDWQKLNYFILCFVDTQDNFKPHFYCIPQTTMFDNPCISLTAMNNTASANRYNKNVGTRTTVNAEDLNWLFKKDNVLKGTSYKHLTSFIKSQYTKLKNSK